MAIYQFSQEAINDLNEICNYLAQNNPRSASNLFDAIRQKCKLVANALLELWQKSYSLSTLALLWGKPSSEC
ncbi:MAG: type II toxin-antitoxin system RelE/ParE family toxin [Microcystis sp. LE19-338.1B]|jgi:hypothetical protein|nr:type II toxin-antitoxin system RelE/ParE family toxin [Microcystis sp. LE19-338.1B]MCZ8357702.1 type II toxin-antitoxin system RelE/ParE family toxin [Microcystis sp. LE19-388.1G]